MKRRFSVPFLLALISIPLVMSACSPGNPLLQEEWDTPFGVPPFDEIEDQHYREAFRAAMAEQVAEIDAIVNNHDPATFENTIEAFERTGRTYGRVARVFGAVNSAHTNDTLQEISSELAPDRLFSRIRSTA